ncbi:ribosomal RNA-processing protein 8 [Enteropsectra breve]|nr:ribosomal RNA-processing protein 8 [Enteropsectra breve]
MLTDELEKKLSGGKFRLLNQKMYMQKPITKEEAQNYQKYYDMQIAKWPADPKSIIITKLKELDEGLSKADLGAGNGAIAKELKNVTSYDLYPSLPEIIKADMEAVPAESGAFDIAITSLSLMKGYISKIIQEVNRIVKTKGEWYIAEVRSRIINTKTFIDNIEKFGFKLKKVETSNSHFIILVFTKIGDFMPAGKVPEVRLRPCLYKKR